MENQRSFLDQVASTLNVKSMDDWYSVSAEKITSVGGTGLLKFYGYSMRKMLKAVYPTHPWKDYKFTRVPSPYWDDMNNQKEFVTRLGNIMELQGIPKSLITRDLVMKYGGHSLLKRYKTMANFVRVLMPDVHTSRLPFQYKRQSIAQQLLVNFVQQIVGDHPVLYNYKIEDLRFQTSTCILLKVFHIAEL
jgi:hypothetical protein